MDDASWLALTAALTALAATWTWFAFRRRGITAGLRGIAITLLPPAALLTGTLELGTEIVTSIGDWAVGLVFSPLVWLGVVLAGTSVMLFGVTGFLKGRGLGSAPETPAVPGTDWGALPPASRPEPAIDNDLADIEEILRRRGIS